MIKSLSVPYPSSDAVLFQKLSDLGLDKSQVVDVWNRVRDPDSGVLQPGSGTLAGTSIADLMFLHAFNMVLENFDLRCDEAGLTSQVSTTNASEILGMACPNMVETKSIAYVDD
eukprot:11401352-Karenia_brevis.AAC.1